MAKVRAFRVGHCTHPSCMAVKGSGFQSRCFPSHAYLIETRAGLVLWDTGYAERFRTASAHGIYRLYPWVTPVVYDPQDSLSAQLKRAGISLSDITTVVISHFHADHMAGLIDFPHARIVCSHAAWDSVRRVRGVAALLKAFLPDLMPTDVEARIQWADVMPIQPLPAMLAPFTTARSLDPSNEVLLVDLPGHAAGQLGAFVETEQGWLLLASDAAWASEAYRALRGPSELSFLIQHSRREYYQTLSRLHQLSRGGQASILLTHEEVQRMPGKPA